MPLDRPLLKLKFKALAAHLSISLVLVGTAVALMWFRWFPAPLFFTDGGGIGLKLLVLVDLVLGPLLTFVVFNPAKGRGKMVFDLAVIGLFQLGAYGYGLHSIHTVRVQAVAFHERVFHAVTANRFDDQTVAENGWEALGEHAPYLVNVRAPRDSEESAGIVAFGFTAGIEPYELHFLYEPLDGVAANVLAQGWTHAELVSVSPDLAGKAARWAQRESLGDSLAALRFYRVEGFYDSAVLVLDGEGRWRGGFAGLLAARPTPTSSSP